MKNSEFLSAIYGSLQPAYGWTTSFLSDPNQSDPSAWSGNPYQCTTAQAGMIDRRGENNNFFCVSVMAMEDRPRRTKDAFKRLAVLLADDARPDNLFGNPSYIIETSPDNYQVGIKLDPKDPDTSDKALLDAVVRAMANAKLINADPSGNNLVRYGRLPVGANTKKRDTGVFLTRLTFQDLSSSYSLSDAVATFGLDLDIIRLDRRGDRPRESLAQTGTQVELYEKLINPNPEQRSYHDPLLKLSSSMVAAGMDKGAVVNHLRSLMTAIRPHDDPTEEERWRARIGTELSRMVASADKFEPARAEVATGNLLLSEDELEQLTKNVRWIVKGLIPEDSMGMIFGASGTYKSFIAIDLAMHVASGLDWADQRTKPGPVVYIAAEGGAGINRRLKAWRSQFGLVEAGNIHICITPLLMTSKEELGHLKKSIAALPKKPSLVIVDTLSQTFNGDENSSSDISDYIRMINAEIRAEFGCTVLVIHHTGHSAAERPRGSSAITANLDFVLGAFRPDPETRRARVGVHKMKDGDKLPDLYFNMTKHVLGEDEDGDELSSLVAEHDKNVTAGGNKYEAFVLKAISGTRFNDNGIVSLVAQQFSENHQAAERGVKKALEKLSKAGSIRRDADRMWTKAG